MNGNEIIGYVGNQPLTLNQLKQEIEEGEKEFERREYFEHENVKEIFEAKWKLNGSQKK